MSISKTHYKINVIISLNSNYDNCIEAYKIKNLFYLNILIITIFEQFKTKQAYSIDKREISNK